MPPAAELNAGSTTRPQTRAVLLLSAAVLGYEIGLMRMLLVASWHHFAFLVISLALLGFGASGTLLCLLRERILPRADGVLFILALATAASTVACPIAAQIVPIEARIVPTMLWRQVGCWLGYWAILAVPFLAGASAIGLALMAAGPRVGRVYAANLIGSGAGCALATATMWLVPPSWLAVPMGGLALAAAAAVRFRSVRLRLVVLVPAVVAAVGLLWLVPPQLRVDPYKYLAYVQRLERQGSAERITGSLSPRSLIEVYRSPLFHDLPFLGIGEPPPPADNLLLDGHAAGSLLRITQAEEAEVVERTLMAVPYALLDPRPRVLLLGERDGVDVWLARRHDALHIEVVQPDTRLVTLMRGPLRGHGGAVFDLPMVQVNGAEPRHAAERAGERFDLIQLVTLQSLAAGSGGMGGLAEDHLLTVEGITASLEHLTPDGLLAACRGIQTPPRDNLKLLATCVDALRHSGANRPENHVVILRDYLAVCLLVRPSPWTEEDAGRIRALCADRQLTPVWFPGVRSEELNRPDRLPGPPGEAGDWYHHGAGRLFGPQAEAFIDDYVYDIRPATDDRPFFFDFCRLDSIGAFRQAFGDLWLTRTELAYLFVLAAIVVITAAGAALTVVPLLFTRAVRRSHGRTATATYFAAIGLAYLLLEMTLLSKITYVVGDPVTAAALTISSFLVFSGLGSHLSERIEAGRGSRLPLLAVVLAVVAGIEAWTIGSLGHQLGPLAPVLRGGLVVTAVAPLAVLMGLPMPTALRRLSGSQPSLVPWAWGVNGFASVLAAPLATAIAMTWGYSRAAFAAILLYLLAGAVFGRLPLSGHCSPVRGS